MNGFFYGQPMPMQQAQPYMPQPQISGYGRGMSATPASNVDWVYVNGLEGARNQIVTPGQTCWMMDNNDPIFYCKSVSNMGQPTLEAYRFEKIDPNSARPAAPQVDMSGFATKDETAQLAGRITELSGKVNDLIKDIGGINV